MRPNKLKAHFENVYPTYQGKDISFFHGLERSLKASKLDSRGIPYHFTEPKTSPPQNDLKFCIHLLLDVLRIF